MLHSLTTLLIVVASTAGFHQETSCSIHTITSRLHSDLHIQAAAEALRRCGVVMAPPDTLIGRKPLQRLAQQAAEWLYGGARIDGHRVASMLAPGPLHDEGRLFAIPPVDGEFSTIVNALASGPLPKLLSVAFNNLPVQLHYLEL